MYWVRDNAGHQGRDHFGVAESYEKEASSGQAVLWSGYWGKEEEQDEGQFVLLLREQGWIGEGENASIEKNAQSRLDQLSGLQRQNSSACTWGELVFQGGFQRLQHFSEGKFGEICNRLLWCWEGSAQKGTFGTSESGVKVQLGSRVEIDEK